MITKILISISLALILLIAGCGDDSSGAGPESDKYEAEVYIVLQGKMVGGYVMGHPWFTWRTFAEKTVTVKFGESGDEFDIRTSSDLKFGDLTVAPDGENKFKFVFDVTSTSMRPTISLEVGLTDMYYSEVEYDGDQRSQIGVQVAKK